MTDHECDHETDCSRCADEQRAWDMDRRREIAAQDRYDRMRDERMERAS
jgi:hypothetical protein